MQGLKNITKEKIFFSLTVLLFLLFLAVLFFNFHILITTSITFLGGLLIRLIFKNNYMVVFGFIFPVISGFASFENRGLPLNYLLLPLILLMGILLMMR